MKPYNPIDIMKALTEFFDDNDLFLRNLMRKIIWMLFFIAIIAVAISADRWLIR